MATILVDMFPANGHYSAILKMAKILDDNGFRVIVSGSSDFRERVEKQGLHYLVTNPLLLIPQKSMEAMGKGKSLFQDRKAYVSNRKAEWNTNFERLKSDVSLLKPSLILLDEQNALKAGAYMALGFRCAFFQTKPDTRRIKGIPPFTSYYIPKGRFFSNEYCTLLWFAKDLASARRKVLRKLKLLTTDDVSIVLEIYREMGLDFSKKIETSRSFGIGVGGVPRIVVSPAPFDFPHDEKKGVFRVGPLVDVNREGKIDQPRYQVLIGQIDRYHARQNGRVVYASMGTITGQDVKRCAKFFVQMGRAARMSPEHLFIFSTGKSFDINLLLPLPDNLLVYESVPQVDLLQQCDIMITHGGMNSITECVFCGVPMLVYPLSRKWDQPGNSARVVYHELGLRGRIERDSARTISRKLRQLTENLAFYKKNVLRMKEQFDRKNNSTEIVNIVQLLMED